MNYKELSLAIRNKNLEPVYFLMGEESYYIDKISNDFATKILNEDEKTLNQIILYGKETTIEKVLLEAKQFPFGSEKRVVIVKEAQNLKNIELLDKYLDNPQMTTILVLAYKSKSIDKRKKFGRELNNKCVVFTSNKLYDNEIPRWILEYTINKGFQIEDSATIILSEHLGSDLSKISNELNKMMLAINRSETITSKLIEYHIGISKDYNIFELQKALGERDVLKANRIINYFAANPKNHNIIPIISNLFYYFQKIMIYHFLKDKSIQSVSSKLKINPFFVKQYQRASDKYSKKQLFNIFKQLKEYDLKSKGINNKNTDTEGLIKELIFKISHA